MIWIVRWFDADDWYFSSRAKAEKYVRICERNEDSVYVENEDYVIFSEELDEIPYLWDEERS